MEALKPDYSGPNVTGVVPALLGVRPVDWMPTPVSGARATVLLVVDGLGWQALQRFSERLPELGAFAGRPITTVVPSTTPAALTSITTGLPPSRHGITGFRLRHERGVLNAIRWQLADGGRPPEPGHVQKERAFCGRVVPVVTKAMFRTTGFTAAHMRGTDFHGWQTTSVLVEEVRELIGGGAPFVYAYYSGVDEVAHAHGLDTAFYPAELAAADRLVGDLLDALPDDAALVVTADHGQAQVGPDGWRSLAPVHDLVETYAGDGRFRYLHAKPGRAAALHAAVTDLHGGDDGEAWVFRRDQLLDEGWLGPDPVPAVYRRVGDVVLAARGPVGFVDPTLPHEAQLIGAHGSITRAEVEIPLVAARGRAR
jgi:Type I phosphodiesterase / nucleotide pyrophosphatase